MPGGGRITMLTLGSVGAAQWGVLAGGRTLGGAGWAYSAGEEAGEVLQGLLALLPSR